MATLFKTSKPGSKSSGRKTIFGLWPRLTGLFGGRGIDNLVEENFPSWEEFASKTLTEGGEFELPPHKVTVTSPLQRNFLYFLMVSGLIGLGYSTPDWGPVLMYGAIFTAFTIALVSILSDSVFFHMEGQRLEMDGELINKSSYGPEGGDTPRRGIWSMVFGPKKHKKTIFRSKLLQIHYQNVIRTFEQGNRRTWVSQDASIGEIQTLLSQRGMKLVWTLIEVLPQLGLVGTLIGLVTMFSAFKIGADTPEISIISGFGTALGTTVFANVFVLILRPLHMQNERSMVEIISTLQTLMAVFILPTQQQVLESPSSGGDYGHALSTPPGFTAHPGFMGAVQAKLAKSLDDIHRSLAGLSLASPQGGAQAMVEETVKIAREVRQVLGAFQQAVNPEIWTQQRKNLEDLNLSVRELTQVVASLAKGGVQAKSGPAPTPQMEHDLLQLRVLTHDTLVLLEKLYQRLGPAPESRVLSQDKGVRSQVFGNPPPAGK
ncbi:MAG: MotA/TolQ/ExbB proton channel family protein [Deltaproteobacteria bacterium]|nr:MotA/TolQ/ExbB proton channel family protein [Deltaproteobacteria bacterium]